MRNIIFLIGIAALEFIIIGSTPGPVGTKRYQPYTGDDSAIVHAQITSRHPGFFYNDSLSMMIVLKRLN
ncbi:hypothetical protein NB069_18935 [Leclercia adecarboxylata]|uniref:hypothetical protein n=1 Tax=Leclercia adecarboxylata TaxID=83655 RepID=UPI00202AC0D0|nr:hypothetical protein [Leclercia adecarboxylata]URN98715.1 hypothetical protein NB069_18935 [Leclercia adecarboxylata]